MNGAIQIKVWANPDNPALRKNILDLIQTKLPLGSAKAGASHPEGMAVAELLVVAISHVTVLGLIEGIRLVWDMYRAPVQVELPNGMIVTLKGASDDLVAQLRVLVESLKQTPQSTEKIHELEELLQQLRASTTA